MLNEGKEDKEVSDTFRKIAWILNRTVLSLTIPEIRMNQQIGRSMDSYRIDWIPEEKKWQKVYSGKGDSVLLCGKDGG